VKTFLYVDGQNIDDRLLATSSFHMPFAKRRRRFKSTTEN
jgi:hypothetical protein